MYYVSRVKRSVFAGNSDTGLETDAGAQIDVDDSGHHNGAGVQANGKIRISNSDVAYNTTFPLAWVLRATATTGLTSPNAKVSGYLPRFAGARPACDAVESVARTSDLAAGGSCERGYQTSALSRLASRCSRRTCRYDSGMDPRSFDALSKVETEHFWFVVRNELIVGLANEFAPRRASFCKSIRATLRLWGFSISLASLT